MNEERQATPTPPVRPQGRIAHSFLLLGGGQIVGAIIGLILNAVLGRTLGPSDFGLYFLIITIAGAMGLVADWGQASNVVREIASGGPDRARYIGSAAALRTILTFVAAAIASSVAYVTGRPDLVVVLSGIAVFAGYPNYFVQFLGYALRGIDRTELDVLAQILSRALLAIMIIFALYFGGGVVAVVLIQAMSGVIVLGVTLRMFRSAGLSMAWPDRATMQAILVAGAPIVAMSLTISVQGLIDVALLSMQTNSESVGWLGAARTFIGILVSPAMVLATASFPEMCRVHDRPDELRRVLATTARPLLAVGALASCGVFVLALPAVQFVYGAGHFDPAALALQVFAPFFPVFFVNFLIGYAAVAIAKSREIAIAKAVCVAISAVLSWFLIPHFHASIGNGVVGLMISFCAAELLMTAAYVTILPRGTVTGDMLVHVARAYLSAAVVAGIALQFAPMMSFWLALPLVPILFGSVALMTGLLRLADIETMVGMARSFAGRMKKPE